MRIIVEVLLIVGSVGITWSSPLSHAAKSTKNVGEPIQEPNKSIQFESTIIKTIAAPLSPSPVMDSASIDSTPDVAKTEGKNSRIRNVRQARSHDHDHDSSDVSPSHLTYSNLPHSFYLQPNERPEMVGMFPVIRDLQPIVPWSFPYGSLPYKFNHYSTKNGEIRRGPPNIGQMSQETLDIGLRDTAVEPASKTDEKSAAGDQKSENQPEIGSVPIRPSTIQVEADPIIAIIPSTAAASATGSTSSLVNSIANQQTTSSSSQTISTQKQSSTSVKSNQVDSKAASAATTIVSEPSFGEPIIGVKASASSSEQTATSSANSVSSSSSSSSLSSSSSASSKHTAAAETVTDAAGQIGILPVAVKGVVRDVPINRISSSGAFKSSSGQTIKGFQVPRDFYPFNYYAPELTDPLQHPHLFNSNLFSLASPHEDAANVEAVSATERTKDESLGEGQDDLIYSSGSSIRRKVSNNVDRGNLKSITIPIKISTRNHYAAPSYLQPSPYGSPASAASAASGLGSAAAAASASAAAGLWARQLPTVSSFPSLPPYSASPLLSYSILLQAIQANRIYNNLIASLLPLFSNPPLPQPDLQYPTRQSNIASSESGTTANSYRRASKPSQSQDEVSPASITGNAKSDQDHPSSLQYSPVGLDALTAITQAAASSPLYRYLPYVGTSTSASTSAYSPYGPYRSPYLSAYPGYSSASSASAVSSASAARPMYLVNPYQTNPNSNFITIRMPASTAPLMSPPINFAYRPNQAAGVTSSITASQPYSAFGFSFPNTYPNLMYGSNDQEHADKNVREPKAIQLGNTLSSSSSSSIEKHETKSEIKSETKSESNVRIQSQSISQASSIV